MLPSANRPDLPATHGQSMGPSHCVPCQPLEHAMTTPITITLATRKAAAALDAAYAMLSDACTAVTRTKIAYDRARCDASEARLAVADAKRVLSDAERRRGHEVP